MAKGNSNMAAKAARQGAQYYNGCVIDNRYKSQYDQGHDAYFNRTQFSYAWSNVKKQGWRSARDSDLKLLRQVHKPHVVESVKERLNEMLGLGLQSVTAGGSVTKAA